MKKLAPFTAPLPGIGVALLPRLACPSCWPAYAGLASSLGLGFLLNETIMLWLTMAALFISVGFLAYRPGQRRGFKPFFCGLGAAALIIGGKFTFDLSLLFYSGIILLIAASLWNSWPPTAAGHHSHLKT